jgi:diguanylate cyclase (GGDEF)-like protein/PAS domain S-box-containing protein
MENPGKKLRASIETRVAEQAELLDAIVSTMAQGLLVVDARGRIVTTNERVRVTHNLPDELCVPGTHFLELARFAAARGYYGPGDPELLAQARWRAASAGNNRYRELSHGPTGLVFEVTGRSMPGGGFVNTYTDVTESLAREAALRDAESRFRLLAENSSDVICLNDANGVNLYVSPAIERLLGWKPEELSGRNALEFVHPEDRSILSDAQLSLAKGDEESTALCRYRCPDGSWVWVEGRARGLAPSEAHGTECYVVVLRDATERKHTELLLKSALERLQQAANTDGLTGLANRRRFDEVLQKEWRRCSRRNLPLSVMIIDADHFKLFNDRYGHLAGDECLRAIASQIAAVARRPGDLAARYGGEEFVVLMPETLQEGALHLANRLCTLVQRLEIKHAGNPATGVVTVSIGLGTSSPDAHGSTGSSAEALVSAADTALYQAKRDGRNRVAMVEFIPEAVI